ncbi:NAD(P)-dependent oxidoreductase [Cellulomonas sp. ATA003]|uniref:NAD-dependent epimerase/dehydratase family protein n=1 Tax=Cellulomonas sp. ATA003 TaxID=3073064 RepID=UPI002872DDB2|nr:NAD(P)-dependent oxidoreductase [Cellulomonas sp. ATA003]WNB86602.1 NAD(P)-dependent oxidoreductase [Cellulomonas sp. ATA003]
MTPTDATPAVVLSGAAGRIGTYLRRTDGGLAARGWGLRLLDAAEPDDVGPEETFTLADITEEESRDALETAMAGADAVVHLAGIPSEDSWTRLRRANVDGTFRVLEAARRTGVRRVVLASSNHAVGYYPLGEVARVDDTPRPDSFYGVTKVAGEALGSLYADKYGVEVVSLRIGMCADRPRTTFDLGIWLSPADVVRLVDAALRGPVDGPVVAYGVSANTRGWWDLTSARDLGYDPQDDGEVFADDVEAYDWPDVLGHGMVATDPLA